jgi:hypothetical protein
MGRPEPGLPISLKDRRDATLASRRLREERVLHVPARIWAGTLSPYGASPVAVGRKSHS